jgi:tetratricopeptide (TPR) repeat protein
MRLVPFVGLLACIFSACSNCLAQGSLNDGFPIDCGNPFKNAYGPFDYRTATKYEKNIVETHHFTPDVETLRHGITSPLGGELDYTLRAFPNHPRALMSMIRLGKRDRTPKPKGAEFTVDCYLQRAVQFRPDDMNARQLRGIYYAMQHRYREAIEDFKTVLAKEPNDANAHYNLGLSYFEIKNYDEAVKQAKLAKSLGFPLPGLQNMLKSAGKWTE